MLFVAQGPLVLMNSYHSEYDHAVLMGHVMTHVVGTLAPCHAHERAMCPFSAVLSYGGHVPWVANMHSCARAHIRRLWGCLR